MNETFRRTVRPTGFAIALVAGFAFPGAAVLAQNVISPTNASEASQTLPDEPGIMRASSSADPFAQSGKPPATSPANPLPEASRTESLIQPGQAAPKITANDKVVMGFKDAFSPFAAAGWVLSAGWEQLTNGSPNYGTNGKAFAQRLGASALRDTTEGLFSESILAPVLHEDPRYYRMGPSHKFFARAVYSATRVIITRTDGGRSTLNLANLGGTLAGAALTNAYYPQLNRGGKQTMLTFGGSLGGSALGNLVSEFLGDALQLFHSGHP